MTNQTTSASEQRVNTEKLANVFGNNDGARFNIHQTFNTTGATPEQLDDVLQMMRQQVETANLHAKIIAKLLNLDI